MKTFRAARLVPGVMLVTALAVGGCKGEGSADRQQASLPATMTVTIDVSSTNPILTSAGYADDAIARVGDAIVQHQAGDKIRVYAMGSRTMDRAREVFSMASSRATKRAKVRKLAEEAMHTLIAESRQNGGDGRSNLQFTLENIRHECAPGSVLYIFSDGLENSEAYHASKVLASGQPIKLPPPATPYLKGCSVEFIGIGMSPQAGNSGTAQTLPNDQLQRLITGWREYLIAAGVNPDAITFNSIL